MDICSKSDKFSKKNGYLKYIILSPTRVKYFNCGLSNEEIYDTSMLNLRSHPRKIWGTDIFKSIIKLAKK